MEVCNGKMHVPVPSTTGDPPSPPGPVEDGRPRNEAMGRAIHCPGDKALPIASSTSASPDKSGSALATMCSFLHNGRPAISTGSRRRRALRGPGTSVPGDKKRARSATTTRPEDGSAEGHQDGEFIPRKQTRKDWSPGTTTIHQPRHSRRRSILQRPRVKDRRFRKPESIS